MKLGPDSGTDAGVRESHSKVKEVESKYKQIISKQEHELATIKIELKACQERSDLFLKKQQAQHKLEMQQLKQREGLVDQETIHLYEQQLDNKDQQIKKLTALVDKLRNDYY